MSTYDVVAGVDNETLNVLVNDLYHDLYPNVLTGTVAVGEEGIASVRYDVQAAPILTLARSGPVEDHFREALETSAHPALARADSAILDTLRDAASAASFVVRAPQVQLGLTFDGGAAETVLTAVLTAGLLVRPGAVAGTMTVSVETLDIEVPGEPVLTSLIANVVAPRLKPVLNAELEPIVVPPVRIPVGSGVTLGQPTPVTQPPHLLAFSALDGAAEIPGAAQWPTGGVFVGVGTGAVKRIANTALPGPISDSFGFAIVSVGYRVDFGPVGPVSFGADGAVSVRVAARATADLTIDLPWPIPNLSVSPSASIAVDARAHAEVVEGTLSVVVDDVGTPDIEFDFGIPDWVLSFIDPAGLHEKLVELVLGVIGNQLEGRRFGAVRLPRIPLTIKGALYEITLEDLAVSGITGADGVELLVVRGMPRFAPGVPVRRRRREVARTGSVRSNGAPARALVPTA